MSAPAVERPHDLLQRVGSKVRQLGEGSLLLRPGRLFTARESDSGAREGMAVLIEDGTVSRVATATELEPPPDCEVFDAPEHTLLPGLIETHCHVTGEWASDAHATHIEPFPEARVLRGLLDAWSVLDAGFTTLFSMGHGHPNFVAALKTLIDDEGLTGPRIYHCGWALSQSAGHGHVRNWNYELVKNLRPRSAFADGPTALRALVRENVGLGASFLKLFAGEGGYSAPEHILRRLDFTPDEIRAVCDEAHRMGFMVASHCMTLRHVEHALENGVDRIEHGPISYEPEFVPMLQAHGARWCPTLSQLHWGLVEREKRGFDARTVQLIEGALDARCRMIGEALDAGVVVGFGTDNRMRPKAGSNGVEFRLMTERGVSNEAALAIGTRLAARLVGLDGSLGTVENGKLADLILVDGNPLEEIGAVADRSRIAAVFRSGKKALPVERASSLGP